jgi:hypothetical protein
MMLIRSSRFLIFAALLTMTAACNDWSCGFGAEKQRADGSVEPIYPRPVREKRPPRHLRTTIARASSSWVTA